MSAEVIPFKREPAALPPLEPFERDAVVQLKGGGPNMLVVRSDARRTVAVWLSDEDVRVADFPTYSLTPIAPASPHGKDTDDVR